MKNEKKSKKKSSSKGNKSKSTSKKKSVKKKANEVTDPGLVIVEEDFEFDKDKINEERRAYLEEARSQEASD